MNYFWFYQFTFFFAFFFFTMIYSSTYYKLRSSFYFLRSFPYFSFNFTKWWHPTSYAREFSTSSSTTPNFKSLFFSFSFFASLYDRFICGNIFLNFPFFPQFLKNNGNSVPSFGSILDIFKVVPLLPHQIPILRLVYVRILSYLMLSQPFTPPNSNFLYFFTYTFFFLSFFP